jgi:hypothetical protein
MKEQLEEFGVTFHDLFDEYLICLVMNLSRPVAIGRQSGWMETAL